MKLMAENGGISLNVDHAHAATGWAMIMNAIGTDDPDFLRAFVSQVANAGFQGQEPDSSGANFILSVVKSIEPATNWNPCWRHRWRRFTWRR